MPTTVNAHETANAGRLPAFHAIAIDVANLRKSYGAIEAIRGINFQVFKGEIFGLIGADGAGKTSTFQILGGVMEATSGRAEIFKQPARQMRSQTGYLTQSFSLYPDLTVAVTNAASFSQRFYRAAFP